MQIFLVQQRYNHTSLPQIYSCIHLQKCVDTNMNVTSLLHCHQ